MIFFANLELSGQDNSFIFVKGKKVIMIKTAGKKSINENTNQRRKTIISIWYEKTSIDGFNKMHRGTDFAAPMGTPIMASGDGVVKKLDGVEVEVIVLKLNTTLHIKLFMHICQSLPEE